MLHDVAHEMKNNFNLKNTTVDLMSSSTKSVSMTSTVKELEALRTSRATPASKHGLEVICGASCETGAL